MSSSMETEILAAPVMVTDKKKMKSKSLTSPQTKGFVWQKEESKMITPSVQRKRDRGSCSPFGVTPTAEQAKDQRHNEEKPALIMTPASESGAEKSAGEGMTPYAPIKEKKGASDHVKVDSLAEIILDLEASFDRLLRSGINEDETINIDEEL